MAPPFKMPHAKKSAPKSRSRGRGSVSNPRGRCAAGASAQNQLDRIVNALPISQLHQNQLTEEEEENAERDQSQDDSNAANNNTDESTMEQTISSDVQEVRIQCRCFIICCF